MDRHPQLNGIEGMALALRAVNKRYSNHLTYKGFRVLLAIYHATERGKTVTRRDLLARLVLLANLDSYRANDELMRRLKAGGYLSFDGYKNESLVSVTVQGRNYIRSVETYLRNIRWRDM